MSVNKSTCVGKTIREHSQLLFSRSSVRYCIYSDVHKARNAAESKCFRARFSKVPVTFRARSYILKSKSIQRWRSV